MPLAGLQRKKDTANHAIEMVPTLAVFRRVKAILDPDAPLLPLSVPVNDVSSSRPPAPELPPDTEKNTAVRVVSTVVSVAVPVAVVPVIEVVPVCTVLPSLSVTTS